MDPPSLPSAAASPSGTPTAMAASQHFFPEPTPPQKLRLLCSYGGHIAPRPHDKALCYVGGETRIVAVDRRTARSFTFISAHLSHTLLNGRPFYLKYQLPDHDLDSLVSITSDEDLVNMIDELDRLSLSPHATRLRFFLFPAKPEPAESEIHDPKSETWFLDALWSTRRFGDSGSGHAAEGGGESEGKGVLETGSGLGPEAIVLETSSSFGSTGSSASLTNLPATRVGGEEGNGNGTSAPLDLKGTLAPVDSIGSDSSLASPNFQTQNIFYADSVAHPGYDNKASPNLVDTESHVPDLSPKTDLLKAMQAKSIHLLQTTDQLQRQSSPSPPPPPWLQTQPQPPQLEYAHPHPRNVAYTDAVCHPHPHPHYKDNNVCLNTMETESNPSDLSSKTNLLKKVQVVGYPLAPPTDLLQQQPPPPPQPLLQPQLPPQPQTPLQYVHPGGHYMAQYYPSPMPTASYPTVYPMNKTYHPIYFMPVAQAQHYDISMQGHMAGSSSVAASHQPLASGGMMVTTPVVYEGITTAPPAAEYAAKVYRTAAVATPPPTVSSDELEQQYMTAFPLTNETSQSVVTSAAATVRYISEYEDLVHAQIYKSQPPAPVMSSKFQAMPNATTTMLSDVKQLTIDNTTQVPRNPQLL